MKKIVYAIAALALIFTGCAKELDNSTKDNFSKVRLHVKVADQLTKVSADNDGRYHWQAGDKITVFNNAGNSFEFSTEKGGSDIDFGTYDPTWTGKLGDYAMYPASDGHVVVGNEISFRLPDSFAWAENSTNMPMLGKIEGDVATFKAVGGVLKLFCYNIPSGAAKLWFVSSSSRITGDFEIADASEANPVIASESATDDVLEITFAYSANKVFYIPLPTGEIDGFEVQFLDGSDTELFSKTTNASFTVTRNKMIIAPALDAGETVLWRESFTGYSSKSWSTAGSIQTGSSYDAVGNSEITYTTVNGGSNTKTWNESLAGGEAPELLIGKSTGKLTVSNISTGGETSMMLTFHENADRVTVTATNDVEIKSASYNSTTKLYTATVDNSVGAATFNLVFANTDENNVRVDDLKLFVAGPSLSIPSISSDDDALEISVGSLTATTTVALSNPVDALGISCIVNEEAKHWLSASISGTTLTVTAAEANSTAADRDGTVTLKATGAANVVITVTQPTKKVANPSVTATAGDSKFTATWAEVPHATSYVAYLHTATTATPATGGTNITASISESAGTYSITDYPATNDTHYYLYVKVNEVESNYEAVSEYAVVDFTPAEVKGILENPYWASEAYDYISTFGSGKGPDDPIYVKGYVSSASNPSSNYQTYYISDDGSTTKQFEAYRGKGISGANITASNRVNVGDYVVVSGIAVNYNGTTPEFNTGSTIITHNPKLAAPTFSVAEGTYYAPQSVSLSAADGATIYYTIDGSEPTSSSSVYSAPLSISTNTTVKAFAVKADCVDSAVASATYTIEAPTQLVMSAITCSAQTGSSLTFTWTAVSDATGYKVSTDGGESWGETINALTYTWTGLSASTTYTIKVKAVGTANGQYTDSKPGSANGTTTDGSGPSVGDVLYAETFGTTAVAIASYDGSGASSYGAASTISYSCKSTNTKIMDDAITNCTDGNLMIGGKNGGAGEWAKISGIKTYGATKVTVTWAANNNKTKVSIEESDTGAATSANSTSNSATFSLSGAEDTITLVITAGSKDNGRVDNFEITRAE